MLLTAPKTRTARFLLPQKTGAADAGGSGGKSGTHMFISTPRSGMTPMGDFRSGPCDTMAVPEKWPSG